MVKNVPATQETRVPSLGGASQVMLVVKNLPANADVRDTGSVPGTGRSPGVGHGAPLQYSRLKKKIHWTVKPGRLQSIGLQRVGHN